MAGVRKFTYQLRFLQTQKCINSLFITCDLNKIRALMHTLNILFTLTKHPIGGNIKYQNKTYTAIIDWLIGKSMYIP